VIEEPIESNNAPMEGCRKFTHLLGTYADGQLDATTLLEVDEHVTYCETCRERIELDRAIRGSLKRVVRSGAFMTAAATTDGMTEGSTESNAPSAEGMRARVAAAMLAEAARAEARLEDRGGLDTFRSMRSGGSGGSGGTESMRARATRNKASASWRTIVPLASAAALAMLWGAATRGPLARSTDGEIVRSGIDDALLEEFVAEHSHPLPPERTDPKDVRAFEQYVGVPVHPANFERRAGARLVGGRMIPVNRERAAMLQYEIGQGQEVRRVSVLVYDPRRIQVHGGELVPRAVGTAEVRVGRSNGYSVAVTQHAGVGYAVASDLGADKSAQLAALADEN
jgi:anti-sigma factor RsiW